MSEDAYIDSCRKANPHLFSAASIQIKPSALETLIRHAFKKGQASVDVAGAYSGVINQIKEAMRSKSK